MSESVYHVAQLQESIWFGCRWMVIFTLQLANLPKQLIKAMKHLTTEWCPTLHLMGENETTTDVIKFLKAKYQGHSLSVLLFIWTVNPLYFMLRNIKGYSYRIKRTNDITHNVFVNDLKLYISNINITEKQLDLVTTFSKDMGITFAEDKCAYQQLENGKLIKKHLSPQNEQPHHQTS